MKDPIFASLKDDNYEKFIQAAFMLKVLKYGDKGMKLKLDDFQDGRLIGKTIQITTESKGFIFKIVNDPRN